MPHPVIKHMKCEFLFSSHSFCIFTYYLYHISQSMALHKLVAEPLTHWHLVLLSFCYFSSSKISFSFFFYLVHYILQNFTASKDQDITHIGCGKDWMMITPRHNYSANLQAISSLWKFFPAMRVNRYVTCCQHQAELWFQIPEWRLQNSGRRLQPPWTGGCPTSWRMS